MENFARGVELRKKIDGAFENWGDSDNEEEANVNVNANENKDLIIDENQIQWKNKDEKKTNISK